MTGIYVLESELAAPTGGNCELATAVAEADLGRFGSRKDRSDESRSKPTGKMGYLSGVDLSQRCAETFGILVPALLARLAPSLKPLPARFCIPQSLNAGEVQEHIKAQEWSKYLLKIEIVQECGGQFIDTSVDSLTGFNALLCVSYDSPEQDFDEYAQRNELFSGHNPWGVIVSEGAAGFVLTKREVVDTLKLKPQARLLYLNSSREGDNQGGMSDLVRNAASHCHSFGQVYSDMGNSRFHTRDYGIAVGARTECFPVPQNVRLTNELWGFLRNASGPVCLSLASNELAVNSKATLFLYDADSSQTVIVLERKKFSC